MSKGFNQITEEDIEYAVEHSQILKKKLDRIDREIEEASEVSQEDSKIRINV